MTEALGINPLPCFVCGKALEYACGEAIQEHNIRAWGHAGNQPNDGVCFATGGNYGSRVWDSLDGDLLEIAICDDCIERNASRTRILQQIDDRKRKDLGPWPGEP